MNKYISRCFLALTVCTILGIDNMLAQQASFQWPEGKQLALSLSFDDGRPSQVDVGTPLFDQYGVKSTFVVVPSAVEMRLDKWRKAVQNGHEVGNHTLQHPCSGNFQWSREKALENYTLEKMRAELIETNQQLESLLGVKSTVFAYPCGSTFVGRGVNTNSYVPLVAELFTAGRGWLDEGPNDPSFCDLAQLTGMNMDDRDFDQILLLLENAKKTGAWLVLAGHEIGDSGPQTTRVEMLTRLMEYAQDPVNGVWIAPMGEIANYVQNQRQSLYFPRIVSPENDGSLLLQAKYGHGIGPKIEYMPEWEAFGWFAADDRVEWDVKVENSGGYDVYLEWSVSDEEAGKPFVFETNDERLVGKVKESGSWETFKIEKVGRVELKSGLQKMTFRPNSNFEEGALLDLRLVKLVLVE